MDSADRHRVFVVSAVCDKHTALVPESPLTGWWVRSSALDSFGSAQLHEPSALFVPANQRVQRPTSRA
jgi:hypothetical protein